MKIGLNRWLYVLLILAFLNIGIITLSAPPGAWVQAGFQSSFQDLSGTSFGYFEIARLTASDAQEYDYFHTVALSGETLVVGAFREDGGASDSLPDSGAVYVFERSEQGVWSEVAKLTAGDAQIGDFFGFSVSIDGDRLVVGAINEDGGPGDPLPDAGAAYVFERQAGGVWIETAKLTASDAQPSNGFGGSVDNHGTTIVVGAPGESEVGLQSGAAYVFEQNPDLATGWSQSAKLKAENPSYADLFGAGVAVSGDTIVAGAPTRDFVSLGLADAGAVFVFRRDHGGPGTWGNAATLLASDAQSGDRFGSAVSLAGDTLVVGAPTEDGGPGDPMQEAGAAYVFGRVSDGVWGESARLGSSNSQPVGWFGDSVSIDGDVLVVGALQEDVGSGEPILNAGAAYVFERNHGGTGNWGEAAYLKASDGQTWDSFGSTVSISGDVVAVGAHFEDGGADDPIPDSGSAYIYYRVEFTEYVYFPLIAR